MHLCCSSQSIMWDSVMSLVLACWIGLCCYVGAQVQRELLEQRQRLWELEVKVAAATPLTVTTEESPEERP